MTNKEQCLKILKTLSAIEGILRSHAKTSTIPDYIWDEITSIAETLSEEILEPVEPAATQAAASVALPEPVAWMLGCQTMGGDVDWKLSFSQTGAGMCRRLHGESFEQRLYTEQQVRALLAGVSAP